MTLERQLRWLDDHVSLAASGLPNAGETDGLELAPMAELMAMLGDPHRDAPAVHLTGTNGKGSSTHLVTLILREHGLRVGSYGSPHVSKINERIQLDGEPISDDAFADSLATVRLAVEQMPNAPSWFEIMTATAFRYFSDAAVQAAVVEVGMLGRFDATNVIDATVAVLTNISKDHTDGAPGWADRVAHEKAGIVKPGSTLIMGDLAPELRHWFTEETPATTVRLGDDLRLVANMQSVGGRVLTIETSRAEYDEVYLSLHGQHQGPNAALAIAAAEAFLDAPLERSLLENAFAQASIPARFEVVATEPLVVLDGGHNVAGARTAAATFDEAFHTFGRSVLVVGMMRDKDPIEMLRALNAPSADAVVCCQPDWPRALPASELADAARSLGIDPEVVVSPGEAIERALEVSSDTDAILVAGSLYVAGAVRNRLFVEGD